MLICFAFFFYSAANHQLFLTYCNPFGGQFQKGFRPSSDGVYRLRLVWDEGSVFFVCCGLEGGSCLGWEGHGRGRRSADMRSGQSVKAPSMEPMSHCPAEPFCHFHFTPRSPKSGQL